MARHTPRLISAGMRTRDRVLNTPGLGMEILTTDQLTPAQQHLIESGIAVMDARIDGGTNAQPAPRRKSSGLDITTIHPGHTVVVNGHRWTVDEVHPARHHRPAYVECVRTVANGPGHLRAHARTVTADQITEHLLPGELTCF